MLVVPLGVIAIDFWAVSSYGTRFQTLMSWTGQISPLSTVGLTDDMMVQARLDKRYLFFKDTSSTNRVSTDYSLIAYVIQNAFDSNYTSTMWLVTILGFFDLFISCFSYFQFGFTYYYEKEDRLHFEHHTFDNYGCDEAGLDENGNECPPVESKADETDETTTDSL